MPKNIIWTKHSESKMKFYGISKSTVLRVMKNPYRIEEGIAPNTIAVMKPPKIKKFNLKKSWHQEIWVMFQKEKDFIKIISTWRYPGISPQQNPIPHEIIAELKNEGLI